MSWAIRLWDVFYTLCYFTRPTPKYKYVLIMSVNEIQAMALIINSQIHPFIQKHSDLLACEVLISAEEHPFLTYDSYVDCQNLFPFQHSRLTDFRGSITESSRLDILTAVMICPVLAQKHKQVILTAHSTDTDENN